MIIHILLLYNIVAIEPRFPGRAVIHREWQYAGDYASRQLCEQAARQLDREQGLWRCVPAE